MSFIIEYISAYEEKIKLANNNGLFDNAKLFEVFAIEICNIWFNQKFSNLNDVKPNFSYVDLISADKKLYIQVTTNQNVPQKIKNTLEKIKNSTDAFYSSITDVVFFVLSNDSVNRLKDYSGKDRIGKIDFTVKNNLISTNDIISKASSDADFESIRKDGFESVLKIINSSAKAVIDNIIITAFLKYNDQIKADIDLCHSYEGLLETLVFGHYEKAAALLDEFRIH